MPKLPPDVRIPRGSGKAPRICSSCQASGTVAEAHVEFPVVIQNEEFTCRVPRMICSACGTAYSTPQQFDRSIELGVAAFQESHGLLTATKIKEVRESLGLTQPELADRAKVGVASVKRWERGRQVQTAANDQALRNALSLSEASSDIAFVTYEFSIEATGSGHFPIGRIKSFRRKNPSNPEAKRFQQEKLHPEALEMRISG